MEELIFQKVQKGDMIFTLEKDRRSGYPIFDQARVLKVGESKPMASNGKVLGLINNRSESPRNPAPDFEEFKLSMNERLTNQETLLLRIAQELGLDKPKQ